MANAVFQAGPGSSYNDLVELHYHFPKRYLKQVEQTVGDQIIYYEPRRGGGRMAYFATARVTKIDRDPVDPGLYYARVSNYLPFDRPVPLSTNGVFLESAISKANGKPNLGKLGWAVRTIPFSEFEVICRIGYADSQEDFFKTESRIQEVPFGDRDLRFQLGKRAFRDISFSRTVRQLYGGRCAMTGLRLTNESRFEVQAAHIKSVEDLGPDSPRNGIALSRTIHWLFDERALSISETGEIMVARRLVPDEIRRLLNKDGKVHLPSDPTVRPHEVFLNHHRSNFRG